MKNNLKPLTCWSKVHPYFLNWLMDHEKKKVNIFLPKKIYRAISEDLCNIHHKLQMSSRQDVRGTSITTKIHQCKQIKELELVTL